MTRRDSRWNAGRMRLASLRLCHRPLDFRRTDPFYQLQDMYRRLSQVIWRNDLSKDPLHFYTYRY